MRNLALRCPANERKIPGFHLPAKVKLATIFDYYALNDTGGNEGVEGNPVLTTDHANQEN
jgi:hypothetical protein